MLPIAQEVAKERYLDLISRLTDPSIDQLTVCAKRAVMAAEILQDEIPSMSQHRNDLGAGQIKLIGNEL